MNLILQEPDLIFYVPAIHCIELLERWEVPPVSEANKKLERLEREMKKQNDALEELR